MYSIEGIIVNNGEHKRARIEMDQATGFITNVLEPTGVADVVLKEEIIFPGFIDLHVHAREDISHTQEYKETFFTAGEAAINGGVVGFLDMPNNPIAPIDDASYEAKNNLTKSCPVEIFLYGGIGPKTLPLSKRVPYKVFMGQSVGDLFFTSSEDLEKVIAKYAGQNVSFHCEDPKILESNSGAITHEAKRPKEAEISAIDFAIELIEKYNLVGKICHASTVEGIEKIIAAKNRGVNIRAEVTPHHLYFDETMITDETRKSFQVNPPIRQTKENRLALIKFLKEGQIDFLATDHAPHTVEEKIKGTSGLTHLDTYGPFTSWLYKEHSFSPEEIARVCSVNPANFLNEFLEEKKLKYGKIEAGYVASFSVMNMEEGLLVTKDFLKTKSAWSPFEGVVFPGRVAMTIIKAKIYEHKK